MLTASYKLLVKYTDPSAAISEDLIQETILRLERALGSSAQIFGFNTLDPCINIRTSIDQEVIITTVTNVLNKFSGIREWSLCKTIASS